jgi:manganese/zinc/iron transport system permease protein
VATACGLLGPFLVLRRVALLGDAVSHAVLPGIVATFLIFDTRAPVPVILGAALFAVICVLGIEALQSTGLVRSDAAIGLVFPALFSLGVLGVQRYAENLHLDLDATIYGEIAFVPLQQWDVMGLAVARAIPIIGAVTLVNLVLVVALWKELKATSFDPEFARTIGIPPRWLSRLLLVAVAVTAVTAFESVGAILVVTLLIVPAATAYLVCERLWTMVAVTVAIGWLCASAGYAGALRLDASIAGAMGLVAGICFTLTFVFAPRHGLLARRLQMRRARAHHLAVAELPRGG